jgi:penicillin-binding protein 1C
MTGDPAGVIVADMRRPHAWSPALRIATALAVLTLSLAVFLRLAPLEPPESMSKVPGTVVLDRTGAVLERDATEGLRIPVGLEAIAPAMLAATISAEDRRFAQHPGVDPVALLRALRDLPARASGASTITQQLARRLYLASDTGPVAARKAREALLALELEARRSKAEILALYLNDVYYGRGAYGIEAAARTYFGISAGELDVAHAAYLAGLPQRPATYEGAGQEARARQLYVLGRMAEDGVIGATEYRAAAAQPTTARPVLAAPGARQFAAFALAELGRLRPDLVSRPGLIVETTLDAGLQAEAERLARLHLADLSSRNVTDAAIVVLEPGSGRVLAMVGEATDGDPAHGGEINMALAPRQPGSALKPLLYAAALEHGYTTASPLLDVPATFATDQGPYGPQNYDRSFHGVVTLRTALASSLNVPAVRTLNALGLNALLEIAHRFGLATLTDVERYGLSLTLGGGEVRLLDLTSAYNAFAAGGRLASPFAVVRVRDQTGRVLYERATAEARSVLSEQRAFLITDVLSDPDARIPGFGAVTPFELPFPAAAKSGTSTGSRDNWTLGFTPAVTVGVWVGNADGSPMAEVSGVDGAGPIWRDVMMAAGLGRPGGGFVRPPGIVEVTVCTPTGLLPGPDCPAPSRELVEAGTEPTATEHYYGRGAGGVLAIEPPAEASAWAVDAGFTLIGGSGSGQRDAVRIVTPPSGSIFVIAPELAEQRIAPRVLTGAGVLRLRFDVDGRVISEGGAADLSVSWPLEPGAHTLTVMATLLDGRSVSATATYEVRR